MKSEWQDKPLAELVDFQRGLTYAKTDEVASSDNIVLRATNIDLKTNALDLSELRYISDNVKVPHAKLVKKGSILICTASGSKSHLGKVALIDDDYGFAFGGFMGMLTPRATLLPKYLFYAMTSQQYKGFIAGLADGTNINNLKFDDLSAFKVPVPPLLEQKRVVAILDQAFEAIDTAKANTEKSLRSAQELFNRFLDILYFNAQTKAVMKTLDHLCVIGDGNHSSNYPRKEELVSSGVPFIRATNLVNGKIVDDDMRFLTAEKHAKLKKGHLKEGDVLFTNRGEIGKTAIVDAEYDNANLNSQIAWLRCKDTLYNRYLFHCLNSSRMKAFFGATQSGTALQQFTIRQLKDVQIAVVSLAEQKAAASRADELDQESRRLTDIYIIKSAACDRLRSSVLQYAFSGKLAA